MLSSELKYVLTLQAPVQINNEYGTKQEISYEDAIVDIHCNKIDIGGNKMINNFKLFASSIVQFDLRYRTDFDETYRVKFNDRYYGIINIKEKEFHKTITITADLLQ